MLFSYQVYPAPDLTSVWVAHCLDFDVVTQGPTKEDAVVLLREAVSLVLSWDSEDNLDSYQCRLPAPPEEWKAHPIQFFNLGAGSA